MANFPEGQRVTFVATREIHGHLMSNLLLNAERIGLSTELEFERSAPLDDEAYSISEHVRSTWPKTPEDFIGKEHFKAVAHSILVPQKRSHLSRVYSGLVLPRFKSPKGSEKKDVVPADFGLDVRIRDELDPPFPYPPGYKPSRPNHSPSHGEREHSKRLGKTVTSDMLVMRVDGLFPFAEDGRKISQLDGIGKTGGAVVADVAIYFRDSMGEFPSEN